MKNIQKLIIRPILLLFFALLMTVISGCSEPSNPADQKSDRTILVYMAANNSLGSLSYDRRDLAEMQQAVMKGALGKNNRLLIFRAATNGNKSLVEMKSSGQIDTLQRYDATENSVSADFMLRVFSDAKSAAQANDYGLILWSHSLGWTQDGISDDGPGISQKTWGQDGNRTMNIATLGRVMAASSWSWVYFDCCFMGSVEVLYQMRNTVPYVVASATEVPLDGMPYDKNLPLLFQKNADLTGAAQNTYDYYNSLHGEDRTVTISVYDMSKIESLATATRPIYEEAKVYGINDFYNLPLEIRSTVRFYDMGVYVDGLCSVNNLAPEFYENWHQAWSQTVIFHKATPKLWDDIDLSRFTGISTYIPRRDSDIGYLNYTTLDWYDDVAKYLFSR